ncbi:MAG: hypothetical protein DRI89_02890 [Bacteroidetes bacterium]|nr:MAG: hypothetical protein DRI89_02890 [Bacteroidota bacterium]
MVTRFLYKTGRLRFVNQYTGNQFIISKQNNSGMKNLRLFLVLFIIGVHAFSFAQIGIQTNNPDASSALDIVSTNKGLLVPRITLTSDLSSASPVTSPATGLLVYNSGSNQPQGFYYWGGTAWVKLESGTGTISSWELIGNSGTTAGTNFVGTTDDKDLVFKTNNGERMRILSNGRVGIMDGGNLPYGDNKFQVTANTTQIDAISAYSNDGYGVYARTYGLTTRQYAVYGLADGIIAMRAHSSDGSGTGILASGNDVSGSYLSSSGAGGAFTGAKYGVYGKARNTSNGNGVLGVGNDADISVPPTGSGGTFIGDSIGVYGKGAGTYGNGVVGRGTGGSTYHYPTAGSGGAFTGTVGVYGYADVIGGNAVVGSVMGETYSTPGGGGTGGSFSGPFGVYAKSTDNDGTAVVGVGNDGGNYHTLPDGSGGAFSGFHGVYGYAEDEDDGIGVLGIGNDEGSYHSRGYGAGGVFEGYRSGLEAYASRTNNDTYAIYGEYTGGTRDGRGVFGYSVPSSNRGYGVVGEGGKQGVLSINAMATIGNMVIKMDHPLDPKNKILNHYAMESPEVLNMYRGNVHLDGNGEAIVSLPEYFAEININFSYNLTPIGQQAPNLFIKEEINSGGSFVISGGHPNQKISWVVYAERNDLYMQKERENNPNLVEVEKEAENKGKYLMPALYNQPPEMGIFYSGKSVETKADRKNTSRNNKVIKGKDIGDKETVAEEIEVKVEKEE